MAVHALKSAASPANTDRTSFNLALARFANAATAHAVLPPSATMEQELAAGDAVAFAMAQLAATPAPDLPAFNAKLRLILADLGVPALVMECLALEVRRLARGEAGA